MKTDTELAKIVIKLLKGPLYDDDTDWSNLLAIQTKVSDYLNVLGLSLNIYEGDGFAFLSQSCGENEQEEGDETDRADLIPRLISRRRISFEASLLCVILREELERLDSSLNETTRLYIEKKEIQERIRIYFKEKTDETSLFRDLNKYIGQVENLGFIRKVISESKKNNNTDSSEVYEVRRILKAKIGPDFLEDFKHRLEVYIDAL